jgi:hypothetical protein
MNILLDIDGVMVPAAGWKAPELGKDGFPNFSKKAVIGRNRILSETNASLLLTTSHKSKYSVDEWQRIFSERGINAEITKLHKNSSKFNSRKDEVLNWLQNQKSQNNYVIIDDDKSLHDLPLELKHSFVLTSSLVGLNEDIADKAIKILRNRAH